MQVLRWKSLQRSHERCGRHVDLSYRKIRCTISGREHVSAWEALNEKQARQKTGAERIRNLEEVKE